MLSYLRRVLEVKDYYSILEIPPSATGEEVKKAFRRLAHLYHPDKMGNDRYAAARFAEIKEAYEILIHPVRKGHYLQQRWLAQSKGQQLGSEPVNPVTILKKMLELDRYVSKLDSHRIHYGSLDQHLHHLLSEKHIDIINSYHERQVNEEIIAVTLKVAGNMPYNFIAPLAKSLKKLKVNNTHIEKRIDRFLLQHKRADLWDRKKIWVILLLVAIICMAILFSNN